MILLDVSHVLLINLGMIERKKNVLPAHKVLLQIKWILVDASTVLFKDHYLINKRSFVNLVHLRQSSILLLVDPAYLVLTIIHISIEQTINVLNVPKVNMLILQT